MKIGKKLNLDCVCVCVCSGKHVGAYVCDDIIGSCEIICWQGFGFLVYNLLTSKRERKEKNRESTFASQFRKKNSISQVCIGFILI